MTEATEEQISEELNQALKTNPSKTLHQRISFVGRLGWMCFVLMLMAFVLQSIAFSVKPEPILTADPRNGEINGRVLFEDVLVRSDVDVIRDLKAWTSARLSLNSSTIWEDAQIALNHLCSELQEQIYSEWTQTAYLAQIEQTKGVSKVEFNDDEIKLIRPNSKDEFTAVIDGVIKIGIVQPVPQSFRIKLAGRLLPRTQNHSLGIEVCSHEDI